MMPSSTRTLDASDFLIAVVARPVLFVVWAYLLWGTLYGATLAYAAATEGPDALGRVLFGGDPLLGTVSFIAAVLAAVVWSVIGAFAVLDRLRRRTRATDARRDR
jgi:hypothetical protein